MEPEGCRFGYDLWESPQKEIAKHPNLYPTTNQRNVSMHRVINWMKAHAFDFTIDSKPGKFFLEVLWKDCDNCWRVLLRGAERRSKEEVSREKDLLREYLKQKAFEFIKEVGEKGNPSFFSQDQGGNYSAYSSYGFCL